MFKTSLQRNIHIQKHTPQAVFCFESNKQDFSTTETVLQTKYRVFHALTILKWAPWEQTDAQFLLDNFMLLVTIHSS